MPDEKINLLSLANQVSLAAVENEALFHEWLKKITEDEVEDILKFSLYLAVFQKASDLHFKPYPDRISALLRKQGELEEVFSFSPVWFEPLLRIMKNWSGLPSYKTGLPQEGRLVLPFEKNELFVRVSFFPTVLGEKVVCRVLNFKDNLMPLEKLGMELPILEKYIEFLKTKTGMVIICGSAGSGKTTTLYASLLWLLRNSERTMNFYTIEDPVEYIVDEFNQTQVNPMTGLTFASGLRSLLRQDPNVLAVGEIRDSETALIALEAGLTGHLIFATLHAENTKGGLARLEQFGASKTAIQMSVGAVLHQKLVPKQCGFCLGKGCLQCGGKGCQGMTGRFSLEILEMK
jgi:type II secretory ATPase GspE/PulE/Tfp pilus assembly ATPase PilB-like protein